MPFCTQCGGQVQPSDTFCARCGTRQSVAAPPSNSDFLRNLSPRTASLLCYIPALGWIASVIVLASPRFREDRIVRFHAFQGLYLFVVWLIVNRVLHPIAHAMPGHNPMRAMTGLAEVLVFGVSTWM